MTTTLSITILSALAGHGIAWAFDPAQWVKHRLGLTDYDKHHETRKVMLLLIKALNCPPCCSFWSAVLIQCCMLQVPFAAPFAFVLAVMLQRLMPQ